MTRRLARTSNVRMARSRLLLSILFCVAIASSAAAGVIYVDNRAASGNGSLDTPFPTLGEAQRVSRTGDVIYVAVGSGEYRESLTLKRGQMLIGAAYGLDAARVEFNAAISAPSLPAVQGTGPLIRGGIYAAGGNVIAGCTLAPDSGPALAAFSPEGRLDVRAVFIQPARRAIGISLQASDAPVSIVGGSLISADYGSGIFIDGGRGDIAIDHFPVSGSFSTAVAIRGRRGGKISFGSAAPLRVDDASGDAVSIAGNEGTIAFDRPLRIATRSGGRGLVVARSTRVTVAGRSSIDTVNATALDVRDAALDATFERISAAGVAPGRLNEGVVLDKSKGRLAITGNEANEVASGGTIRNAQLYGIRIVQSEAVRVANVDITDSGSAATKCPADIVADTNVRCAAGMYLRHLASSRFEHIRINGGAVGVNTNNVSDLTFDKLDVRNTGATRTDPAVLMQESGGTITLNGCTIADGSGGQLAIEQRFNRVAFVLTRCAIAAPQRPMASEALVAVRAAGQGSVTFDLAESDLRENAGSAIRAEAREQSSIAIAVQSSTALNLGGSFLDVAAAEGSAVRVTMHATRVVARGSDRSLVAVNLTGAARGCVDVSGNELISGGTVPPIAIAARSPQVQLQVVSTLAQAVVAPTPPTIVTSCR